MSSRYCLQLFSETLEKFYTNNLLKIYYLIEGCIMWNSDWPCLYTRGDFKISEILTATSLTRVLKMCRLAHLVIYRARFQSEIHTNLNFIYNAYGFNKSPYFGIINVLLTFMLPKLEPFG